MEKLVLSSRMALIASLVDEGSVLADVGTDHGYIPTWLLINGIIDRAVATDINAGPLSRARQVAQDYEISDSIDLRLCDGLAAVAPHEVNTVVIAGMGGETIISILSAAEWTKKDAKLILQPQSKQPELRRWLYENGYAIKSEHLVKDAGKMYCVFTSCGGSMPAPDTAELYAGCADLHADKALFKEFLEHESFKLLDIASRLEKSAKNEDHYRRAEYIEAAQGMQRMLEEI